MEIASEINKAGQDEENTLLYNIFDYIERKFVDEDFNLTSSGKNSLPLAFLAHEVSV